MQHTQNQAHMSNTNLNLPQQFQLSCDKKAPIFLQVHI